MPRIRGDIVIQRPVDVVFDVVEDQRNEPRYNPQMLRVDALTDPATGPGARWSALVRSGRWPVTVVIERTEFDRPAVLGSITTAPGMEIEGRLTFEPVAEGTRMSWDWRLRPTGLQRLLSPVIGVVGARQERRVWTGLKTLVESSTATSRDASAGTAAAG